MGENKNHTHMQVAGWTCVFFQPYKLYNYENNNNDKNNNENMWKSPGLYLGQRKPGNFH